MTINRVQTVMAVMATLAAACSSGDDGLGSVNPDAGPPGGEADGGLQLEEVAEATRPILTPCPVGWTVEVDPHGVESCVPWPNASPIRWTCPGEWEGRTRGRATTCEPWPSGGPVRWACPEGWQARVVEGTTVCEPFLQAQPCPAGEAHFVGSPGCTTIGSSCPAGDFLDVPTSPRVYVRRGSQGGDGTMARPYGGLSEVSWPDLDPGTVVVLAGGTYTGAWQLATDVTLWGACPTQTILTSPTVSEGGDGVISVVDGGRVTIRNLSFRDSLRAAVTVDGPSSTATIRSVVIDNVARAGLVGRNSGALDVEELVVRDTQPTADGFFGRAVAVLGGASAVIRRAILDGNYELGVSAFQVGTTLELEDTVIRRTQPSVLDSTGGFGVYAAIGATVTLRRSLVEENNEIGVVAYEAQSRVILEDVVVRRTVPRATGGFGYGIDVELGGSVEGDRVLLEDNRSSAIRVSDTDSDLTVRDLVVLGTRPFPAAELGGVGLQVSLGGAATVERAVFDDNQATALAVFDDGSRLSVDGIIVRHTERRAGLQRSGTGLLAIGDVDVDVNRSLFVDNHFAGVYASGGRLTMSDVVVRQTRSEGPADDVAQSAGLIVQDSATASVSRALFEGNQGGGIAILQAPASLRANDVIVAESRPQTRNAKGGQGMSIFSGAQAEIERAYLTDNRVRGIIVNGESRLTLRDAIVEATRSDAEGGRGEGIGALAASRLDLQQVEVSDNRNGGVFVQDVGSQLLMTDGVLRGTATGSASQRRGEGLLVQTGATATVSRSLIDGNASAGVFVALAGSQLVMTDVVVRNTQSDGRGEFGRAMSVQDGARAMIQRVLFADNRDLGLYADQGSHLILNDLTIRDTTSEEIDSTGGRGITLQQGARARGQRLHLSRNQALGILVTGPSTEAELTDVRIEDTGSQERDGRDGIGVSVERNAQLVIRRVRLTGNRAYGAASVQGRLRLEDAVVEGTRRPACAEAAVACADSSGGIASFASDQVEVVGAVVRDSEVCGLLVGGGSDMSIEDTEISGNAIGACIQDGDFDRGRVAGRTVAYDDNGMRISVTNYVEAMPTDLDEPVGD